MANRRVARTEVVDNDAETVQEHEEHKEREAVPYVLSSEFIYWILGIVEGLLVIRFFFRLAGASTAAEFTRFVYSLTNVFMAPFRLIFPTSVAEGAVFEWSILVAIAVYALLAWTLIQLISIFYTADRAS